MISFNGKIHTDQPLLSASPITSFPTLSPFLLSSFLSLHLSHLPKYHKAFSRLCFAVRDADQYNGKASQAEGGEAQSRKEKGEETAETKILIAVFSP